MGDAKYEPQFESPLQGVVIGEHNTINIYQHGVAGFQSLSQGASSLYWNLPFQRNPFFTGRERVLQQLHNSLITNSSAALGQPQAISGLGGIGKTQIAIEYAYRYHDEYDFVFWINAATHETQLLDFRVIANLLGLPQEDEQDQNKVVDAVKRWLATHHKWLLIVDNADEPELIKAFLPTLNTGHLILTTRAQAVGSIASSIEVDQMGEADGTLMLLRRAKILSFDASLDKIKEEDKEYARLIVSELDGLPLALDQAGAYIEETRCSLSMYLSLYQTYRATLLKERGSSTFDHPESVTTTFSLAFLKVQEANSASANLLRLCAFIDADAIPEEIFTDYKPELDPTAQPMVTNQIELNAAIKWLMKFSLVRRNADTKTLTVHRLVQAVLKDEMDENIQHQWAERTIRAVSRSFPFSKSETWLACQRFLPHGYACDKLIQQWNMEFVEAAGLLYRMGRYLHDRAFYLDAELCYQKALEISEKALGPGYIGLATILKSLAELYYLQSKYSQANTFFRRALEISKKVQGVENPHVAIILRALADLEYSQGRYAQAKSLYFQSLKICKKVLGSKHHEVGVILNSLALLYFSQGYYDEAEKLYQQTLAIKRYNNRPDDVNLSSNFSNLANIYRVQRKYVKAEELSLQALSLCEKILGPEHPDVATRLNNLAVIYHEQGKYVEAESLFLRALAIQEKIWGSVHPIVANTLCNLAALDDAQGHYDQAEQRFKQALATNEQTLGPGHPKVANNISMLAQCYTHQGKYNEAEQHFKQALAIWEYTQGLELPNLITTLKSYTFLLRILKREAEALALERQTKELELRSRQEDQKYREVTSSFGSVPIEGNATSKTWKEDS